MAFSVQRESCRKIDYLDNTKVQREQKGRP